MRSQQIRHEFVSNLLAPKFKPEQTDSVNIRTENPIETRTHISTGEEDKDCTDFRTHREAQDFFESAGPDDPHGLDRDGDGQACETLP